MAAIEELRDSLQFMGVENIDEDILASMVDCAAVLGMKPSEIGDSWIAYSLNHGNAALNFDNWMSHKTELNRSMAKRMERKRSSAAVVNSPSIGTPLAAIANKNNLQSPFAAKTPLAPIHPSLFEKQDLTDISSPLASDPASIGTSVFQYNAAGIPSDSPSLALEEKWWGGDQPQPPVVAVDLIKKSPFPFRYMLQKPADIILALNDHLEWLEREAFPQEVKAEQIEAKPLDEQYSQATAQEPLRMIGRLVLACQSNETHEGHGSGVSLQQSLDSGAGSETPLHVMPAAISGFSVCQGQIVSVSGQMAQTSKRLFLAEKIQLPILPPLYVSQSVTKDNDFVALIVAGPFANSPANSQKPAIPVNVSGLASVVRRYNPSVVILVGPFGALGLCEALCRDLASVSSNPLTCIVIPGHSDLASNSPPVYPTQAIVESPIKIDNAQIFSPPDPGMFDVNGSMICATSVDVLRHLAASELHLGAAAGGGGDRLARLAGTLIYQRCMYPLYPQAPNVPVDWPLWRKLASLPNVPSILILPSELNPFMSAFAPNPVQQPSAPTLLVNPGRASRRRAALVRWSAKDKAFVSGRIIRI